MEWYVIRHGQTDWNLENKVQGKADISLNTKGVEQAEKTKEKLENKKIDLIICSPLARAKETAQMINKDRNIPIIYDEQISERDFGEFEGAKQEDFDYEGFWSYKKNQHFQSAENIKEFFYRVYSKLDKIEDKYKDKNILFVTHGGVSIAMDCYVNGMPDQDSLLNLAIGNGEVKNYHIERKIEIERD